MKVNFIELMHEAYEQKEISADEYLVNKLYNIKPYNLTFKKYGEENDEC